jgi:hypothetical protein
LIADRRLNGARTQMLRRLIGQNGRAISHLVRLYRAEGSRWGCVN